MKRFGNTRKTAGSMLGLVSASLIFFLFVAAAMFYLLQMLSGNKQVVNAADTAALASAQQILAVSLSAAEIKQLPQEFTSLGVDPSGNTCPSGTYGPNNSPALFNIIAYDNCAAYTLEIALKAAADGSPTAIANANTVILALNSFAQKLTSDLTNATAPAGGTTSAGAIAAAAYNLLDNNVINNLPSKLFGSPSPATLVPNSLALGYYVDSNPHSNEYFPSAFLAQFPANQYPQFANWISQLVSNVAPPAGSNGSNLIEAGTPFDLNTITGLSGSNSFVDANGKDLIIALVPFQSDGIHLISINETAYHFSASLPNTSPSISTYNLPPNAVYLQGQIANAATAPNSTTSLTVSSAAVVNNAIVQSANITPGYIAIINGASPGNGDYVASMNSVGYTAASLQSQGYANVPLTGSTNIAFNDSQTDIFDLLSMNDSEEGYIMVGTDSPTGVYQKVNPNWGYFSWPENYPDTNYNDVVDGLTAPSIPFTLSTRKIVNTQKGLFTDWSSDPSCPFQTALNAFGDWIAYNTSKGGDAWGHNPNLDPLKSIGGSPAFYAKNPNAQVPNTPIMARSTPNGGMTIADAKQIVDICFFDTNNFLFNGRSGWMNNLMPVIAANYQLNYLPAAAGEYRPNGFTGIEYLKAMVTCLHGGQGISNTTPALPSGNALIFMPELDWALSWYLNISVPGCSWFPLPQTVGTEYVVTSGQRYFVPFDNNGNLAHYAWPEPPGCPKFETPGTPLQLLQNMDIFRNQGTFNPNDSQYTSTLNSLLTVAQQMNANITMTDLTTVLNSQTIDLGQILYLVYNQGQPQNDGLQMVSTLPNGETYQPADGPSYAGCGALYKITQTYPLLYTQSYNPWLTDNYNAGSYSLALIDTYPAPNSSITYNGNSVCTAPYGDNQFHAAPYLLPLGNTSGNNSGIQLYATDMAAFMKSSGSNNNHGDLHFFEAVGDYPNSSFFWTALDN